MKYRILSSALLLCCIAVTTTSTNAGELLMGVKGGVVNPEFDNNVSTDPFAAVTLGIGYEFLDLVAVDIGAELEYTTSLSEGKIAAYKYNYDSLGLVFSLRTAGPIYFIARLGYTDLEFDFTDSAPTATDFSPEDNAVLAGVGIGFSTGVRWEIQLDTHTYSNNDDLLGNEGSAYNLNIGLSF